MISHTVLTSSILGILLWSSSLAGQDLSQYRGFSFGMTLESVAKQAGMNAPDARTIHERPELIQDLVWLPRMSADAAVRDSVGSLRFSFFDDKLFRMTVIYSVIQVDGMTAADIIESVSSQYGTSASPDASFRFSSSTGYETTEKVLARWEDADHSIDLFRPSYQTTFGLILSSKSLDLLADAAVREAQRLDKLEAPAREITRQQEQDDSYRLTQEKARLINKPRFRP